MESGEWAIEVAENSRGGLVKAMQEDSRRKDGIILKMEFHVEHRMVGRIETWESFWKQGEVAVSCGEGPRRRNDGGEQKKERKIWSQ